MENRQAAAAGAEVLVVEDDASTRALVCDVLAFGGYSCVQASSGEEALATSRHRAPMLVVLDVHLPGMSGYEVCRALRDEFGDGLPILFLSGERVEPFDRVAGLLVGGDDYVVKPFAPDELLARVQALLRRSGKGSVEAAALTSREFQILRLLAEGLNQQGIARRLTISPKTVATHIEHVLGKLGVHSRAEAVAYAYRERLLEVR